MGSIDAFEKNKVCITGLVIGEARFYRHRENLCTLRISARSQGKTFFEDVDKVRRETVHVELHGTAAERAQQLEFGDIVYLEGHLGLRHWKDRDEKQQTRLVIVVNDMGIVARVGEAALKHAPGDTTPEYGDDEVVGEDVDQSAMA